MATERVEQLFDRVAGRRKTHGHRYRARMRRSDWDDPLQPRILSQLIKEDGLENLLTGDNDGVLGTQKDITTTTPDWPPTFGSIVKFNISNLPVERLLLRKAA